MDIFEEIRNEAEAMLSKSKGSHDWEHTERVLSLCRHLGEKAGADLEILELAAALHDIGRPEQDESQGKICHARRGAELAREILERHSVSEDKISRIIHYIEAHRFRDQKEPETLEAKILFDADKLDSIGAVGIGRAFLFAGEIGAMLHSQKVEGTEPYTKEDTAYREFVVKLRKVKGRMLTPEGIEMAEERHQFMEEFFDRLNKETEGEL